MQGLRLKQRVLDVQSKVFKRRTASANEASGEEAGVRNAKTGLEESNSSSSNSRRERKDVSSAAATTRVVRRSPSIASLASSTRRRLSFAARRATAESQSPQRPPASASASATPTSTPTPTPTPSPSPLATPTPLHAAAVERAREPPAELGQQQQQQQQREQQERKQEQQQPPPPVQQQQQQHQQHHHRHHRQQQQQPQQPPAASEKTEPGPDEEAATCSDKHAAALPPTIAAGAVATSPESPASLPGRQQPHLGPSTPPSTPHPIVTPRAPPAANPAASPPSPHALREPLQSGSPLHAPPPPPPPPAHSSSPAAPPDPRAPHPHPPPPSPDTPSTPRKLSFTPKLDPTAQSASSLAHNRRPSQLARKQSILPNESTLILDLLNPDRQRVDEEDETEQKYAAGEALLRPPMPVMAKRKVWVKRGATGSATAITVSEEDLVDDARDVILKKFYNSLSKTYDAPDITLFFPPRGSGRNIQRERLLSPDENIVRAIDEYFPKGQSADDALIIEVPRRTPRPSPGPGSFPGYIVGDEQDYFTPLPGNSSTQGGTPGGSSKSGAANSMAIVNSSHPPHVPNMPSSPRGAPRPYSSRGEQRRPQPDRRTTGTPILQQNPPVNSPGAGPIVLAAAARGGKQRQIASDASTPAQPSPAPLEPTPELIEQNSEPQDAVAPPARVSSPPINKGARNNKKKKELQQPQSPPPAPSPAPAMHVDGAVPPIKVLIVEDNIINLRLLEAFMRRLKVRWESAINGKIAVDKWRAGGFHLVLMDIQLPVMNGLDATKEIRRLERVNRIGAFPHTKLLDGGAPEEPIPDEIPEEDRLPDSVLLRSPVIIVALTASSLQSDRHEAYAAGCNDFLTKPVNFIWLERKVTEWGCMQALIDFDGWKTWCENPSGQVGSDKAGANGKAKINRLALPTSGTGGGSKKSPGAGGNKKSPGA